MLSWAWVVGGRLGGGGSDRGNLQWLVVRGLVSWAVLGHTNCHGGCTDPEVYLQNDTSVPGSTADRQPRSVYFRWVEAEHDCLSRPVCRNGGRLGEALLYLVMAGGT